MVWFARPSLAPGISVFPVLGIAAIVVQALPHYKQLDSSYWLLFTCVIISLAFILFALRNRETHRALPLAISFALVLGVFVTDRLFTDKVEVHAYSMRWTADGKGPWGNVQLRENGEPPVVVYRTTENGYCYDALFSTELRVRLTQSNRPTVRVEYNVFKDFGRERGYNVRSVDGMVFKEGSHAVRPENGYGGQFLNGSGSSDCRR